MKNTSKLVAATLLAGTFFANSIIPALSQNYQPGYNMTPVNNPPSYNQNYTPAYNQNYNQQNYSQQNYLPPLQGRIMVPAGTALAATIASPISSEYARIGDVVTTSLGNDLYAGGSLVLPAGSTIQGRVVDAQSAGLMNKNGRLNIRFDSAIAPNGKRYNISGKISTPDGTGVIYGGTAVTTMTKVAKNAAVGSAVGAVSGVALGGITGKPGRGAWAGTAIGGGTGLLGSFFTKGKEAIIPGNTRIDIMLDQPMQDGY